MPKTENIPTKQLSWWMPESDKQVLAVVGKLGEEAAELAKICFRITIQGIDGVDPETFVTNITELENEIADVRAMMSNAIVRLELNPDQINVRTQRKLKWKKPWFDFLWKIGRY